MYVCIYILQNKKTWYWFSMCNNKNGRHDTSNLPKLPCEGDYSVSVQNSISGNLPGTWIQTYVWHRGGRNVSIVYDHQEPWWQLDNSEAGKQSNVAQHVVWHCHALTFQRVLASPFAHLLDCVYHVFDSVKIIHCQRGFLKSVYMHDVCIL